MYCKQCGHRTEEKTEKCPKCGRKFATAVDLGPPPKRKLSWRIVVIPVVISVIAFVVVPRVFLRTELESIGPTDKVRFRRAMGRSEYRGVGQREILVEGQTLIVVWDLRWNTLGERKKEEIVHNIGKAWEVVGGEETRFRIEGQ